MIEFKIEKWKVMIVAYLVASPNPRQDNQGEIL